MKKATPLHIFNIPLKGINLVESSAGTGKTYNIAALYVRAVAEFGLMPQQIVVVTFTKAATQELRERIGLKLKEAYALLTSDEVSTDSFLIEFKLRYKDDLTAIQNLKRGISNFDLAQISTIHGFCQQALQEFIFESNKRFDINYSGDEQDMISDAIDDLWRPYIRLKAQESSSQQIIQRFLINVVKSPDALKDILIKRTGKPYLKYALNYSEEKLSKLLNEWQLIEKQVINSIDLKELDTFLESPSLNKKKYNSNRKNKIRLMLSQWKSNAELPFQISDKDLSSNIELLRTDSIPSHIDGPYDLFSAIDTWKTFHANKYLYLCEHIYVKLSLEFESNLSLLKEKLGQGSFDDILINMMEAVKREPMLKKIREAYPLALVDEFQDTDPIQLEIFKIIYSDYLEGGLFMIGDPKQSIYGFRGADIQSYLSIRESDSVNIYQLGENYRSSSSLVEAINELFDCGEGESLPGNIPFYRSVANKKENELFLPSTFNDAPIQFIKVSSYIDRITNKVKGQEYAIQYMVDEIVHLLQEGQVDNAKITTSEIERGLQPRDICVLVFSHSEANRVKQSLLSAGVKSITNSKQSVFLTNECQFIIDFISLVKQPSYLPFLKYFLFTNYMGWSVSHLMELEENDNLLSETIKSLEEIKLRFERFGFSSAFQSFLNLNIAYIEKKRCSVEERILSLDQNERRYTNLIHLSDLIVKVYRKQKMGAEGLLKWLQKRKLDTKDEYQIRLESDDNLVQIVTIHYSKGLEFPIVFCPFLWHHLPPKNSKYPVIYHAEKNNHIIDFVGLTEQNSKELIHKEQSAEYIRLAYVALTRAKYRCYIQLMPYDNGKNKTAPGSLSYMLADYERKKAFINGENLDALQHLGFANKLCDKYPKLFNVLEIEPIDRKFRIIETTEQLVNAKSITRTNIFDPSWYITSYSGLKKKRVDAIRESDDEKTSEDNQEQESSYKLYDIFHFPKGAHSGVLMHALFEQIDFTNYSDKAPELISNLLEKEGIDKLFSPILFSMIQDTLSKKLPHSNATLFEKDASKCVKEMEFYFPIKQADIDAITTIIDSGKPSSSLQINAFMTGFIDLIFEHNGAYYIVDYKSDHLGYKPSNYTPNILRESIYNSGYHYQYHIYTVAVIRALKRLLGDKFNYNAHFGGCYYLYLRGIQNNNDSNGIFFDKPTFDVIQSLDSYFGGAN